MEEYRTLLDEDALSGEEESFLRGYEEAVAFDMQAGEI